MVSALALLLGFAVGWTVRGYFDKQRRRRSPLDYYDPYLRRVSRCN
jgi:hypothetical protein